MEVLNDRLRAKGDDSVALLPKQSRIAKLPRSFVVRSRRVHALGDKVSLNLSAMKRHFFVKLAGKLLAIEQQRYSSQKSSH
jgi:hypothetical protein